MSDDGFIPDDTGPGFLQPGSQSYALSQGVGMGMSLGMLPYLRAFVSQGDNESYSDAVTRSKAEMAQETKLNPGTMLGGQLAGGIVPAVLTGGESLLGSGATAGARLGSSIIARNALTGAVSGAATTEPGNSYLAGAGKGAAIGSVASGLAGGTIAGASALKSAAGSSALSKAVVAPAFQQKVYNELLSDPTPETFQNYTTLFGQSVPKDAEKSVNELKTLAGSALLGPQDQHTSAQAYQAWQAFNNVPVAKTGIAPTISKMYADPKSMDDEDWNSLIFGQDIGTVVKGAATQAASNQPGFWSAAGNMLTAEGKYGAPVILGAPAYAAVAGGPAAGVTALASTVGGALGGAAMVGAKQSLTNKAMMDVATQAPQWSGSLVGAVANQALQQPYQVGSRLAAVTGQAPVNQAPFNPTYQYGTPPGPGGFTPTYQYAPPASDGFIPD